MSNFCDPTPIAPSEQYRAALLAVRQRMTADQLAMLQAHCKSADHAISASRLAELLGMATTSSANLKYSNYAHWIADELKFAPDPNSKSNKRWWLALAYARPDAEETADGEPE